MNSTLLTDTAAQTAAVGSYQLDPRRTTIRIATRHLLGLGSVSGTFLLRQAAITVRSPAATTELTATIDAASFDSGNAKRDKDIRSAKYLDVENYPAITFACPAISQLNGGWTASGTVTAHGVSAPVTLTLDELDNGTGELTFTAHATIDRYAHGMTAGKAMVGRRLTVHIAGVATR